MKVLFLDVDGVLKPGNTDFSHEPPADALKRLLQQQWDRLKEIAKLQVATGVKIVIISNWREQFDDPFLPFAHHPEWRTDVLPGSRGEQIERWRAKHKPDMYCIVDDNEPHCFLESQLPFFVKTQTDIGLQDEHVARIKGILGSG